MEQDHTRPFPAVSGAPLQFLPILLSLAPMSWFFYQPVPLGDDSDEGATLVDVERQSMECATGSRIIAKLLHCKTMMFRAFSAFTAFAWKCIPYIPALLASSILMTVLTILWSFFFILLGSMFNDISSKPYADVSAKAMWITNIVGGTILGNANNIAAWIIIYSVDTGTLGIITNFLIVLSGLFVVFGTGCFAWPLGVVVVPSVMPHSFSVGHALQVSGGGAAVVTVITMSYTSAMYLCNM